MDGELVSCGLTSAATGPTGVALVVVEPLAFLAVTSATIVWFWSAATSLYVCAVAPEIVAQFVAAFVSQRSHLYV